MRFPVLSLAAFAALSATALTANAANLAVTTAKIDAGKLVIAGTAARAGDRVFISGTELGATAASDRSFRIFAGFLPPTCKVLLKAPGKQLNLVIANCGPKGAKGDTGATGPRGATGPAGPRGPAGLQGPAGAAGPQGPKGDTGPQGPKGDTGPQGETGPRGFNGLDGIPGTPGLDGRDGTPGPVGPIGPQGLEGPQGAQGPQGLKGDKGDRGLTGARGPQGPAGETGPRGATGSFSGKIMWAEINRNGGRVQNDGVPAARKLGSGVYLVTFARDLEGCSLQATLAPRTGDDNASSIEARPRRVTPPAPREAIVTTSGLFQQDSSFNVLAVCTK